LFEGVNVTVARGKKWRYSRRGMLAIVFFKKIFDTIGIGGK
jgi:hypothetical protein